MTHAFLYGLVLAFGLIIPLGVQNIFIFNQGASQPRFIMAMPSVLTAAICDTLLILIAVLGVSLIVLTITWLKNSILIAGAGFLFYMGWITWKNNHKNVANNTPPYSAKRQILFAASVSLLNPHALIDSISVIGSNALNFSGKERICYTLACVMISWAWFLALSIAGHFFHRLDKSGLTIKFINKFSALIMWAVAVYIVGKLFFY